MYVYACVCIQASDHQRLIQYKYSSYQCRNSHCIEKIILWEAYLHNGNSCTGKTTSLYWIRALVIDGLGVSFFYLSSTRGANLNIKMLSYHYGNSQSKMVLPQSYLYNGNSYIWKDNFYIETRVWPLTNQILTNCHYPLMKIQTFQRNFIWYRHIFISVIQIYCNSTITYQDAQWLHIKMPSYPYYEDKIQRLSLWR